MLPLPLQFLWSDEQPGAGVAGDDRQRRLYQKLPPAALTAPNTPIDQTQTINAALRRYRLDGFRARGIGLALIAVAVLAVYGWRRGVFMLVDPGAEHVADARGAWLHGADAGAAARRGPAARVLSGQRLFDLPRQSGRTPRSTHRAILLAASTALLSFGVLSFSKIEALKDICLTVTLVIAFVLVFCEAGYRLFVRRTFPELGVGEFSLDEASDRRHNGPLHPPAVEQNGSLFHPPQPVDSCHPK